MRRTMCRCTGLLRRSFWTGFTKKAFGTLPQTLRSDDATLQTRGYPTLSTGYYTAEPVYADLIRIALTIGYKVTPYEIEYSPFQQTDNPVPAMNVREQEQA